MSAATKIATMAADLLANARKSVVNPLNFAAAFHGKRFLRTISGDVFHF